MQRRLQLQSAPRPATEVTPSGAGHARLTRLDNRHTSSQSQFMAFGAAAERRCVCGNALLDDSTYCRKCGRAAPRSGTGPVSAPACPQIHLLGNRHQLCAPGRASSRAAPFCASCAGCGNVLMGDSAYCRKCGTPTGASLNPPHAARAV